MPTNDKKRQFLFGVKIIFVFVALIIIAAICFFLVGPGRDEIASKDMANLYLDLRAAVSPISDLGDPNIGKTVAELVARVGSLEAENQQLRADMDQLVDHDGVIERLVTHVRALHAQSEATRRDVVNALMAPIENGDQPMGVDGLTQTPSLEGEANPLLTKARHTIVTPVVVTAPAAVAAATPEKRKAKPAPAEPEEGNTN